MRRRVVGALIFLVIAVAGAIGAASAAGAFDSGSGSVTSTGDAISWD
jgi:hypothetical protein